MQERLHQLRDVLCNSEAFPWKAALYLPKNGDWQLSSVCAVLIRNQDREDIDEEPKFAVVNDLRYVLQFSDVQGIVCNAKQQLPNANEDELFRAFEFYVDNDAFIDFSNEES
ncbi:hypothetical protein [Acaryochloris sp. CCMEE 5410]|uniref:DUF7716 domain-containing protein n=1 Tax=Acaryochloris sp. CCMEE 5410 TaxID=310037 RepID=UPI0002E89605|nr:hypothetical protein [Acaryochloris sp. CCMEE 5410]KAI9133240.1 hypothetical protein ON05_007875 [Acaryochloris sp. CCMEE 5410]